MFSSFPGFSPLGGSNDTPLGDHNHLYLRTLRPTTYSAERSSNMGTKKVTLILQFKKHQQLFKRIFGNFGGCKDLVNLVKGGSRWEGNG